MSKFPMSVPITRRGAAGAARAVIACLSLAAVAPPSLAGLLYSAGGGTISGSLGDTPFSDASWSMTATDANIDVQSGTYVVFPVYYNALRPTIRIVFGSTTLEANLLDEPAGIWAAATLNYEAAGIPGFTGGASGFYRVDTSSFFAQGFAAAYSLPLSDLVTTGSWSGLQTVDLLSYATSAGTLNILGKSDDDAFFSIAEVQVPLPGTLALLVLGAAGLRGLDRRSGRRVGKR